MRLTGEGRTAALTFSVGVLIGRTLVLVDRHLGDLALVTIFCALVAFAIGWVLYAPLARRDWETWDP